VEPWIKDYAAELSQRGLYEQAARAYEQYLHTPGLSPKVKANVHYMIGDIYRENIYDYDSAIAHYLKVKYLDPDTELSDEIDRKVVECLEKSGRSVDAKREMDKIVSAEPKDDGGEVVAEVSGEKITRDEFHRALARMGQQPENMTRQERTAMLESYIANRLMANAAERKGYAKDPEVLNQVEDARRAILAQKILREEIDANTQVDREKVRLYYDAHKDEFLDEEGEQEPFEDVANQIFSKLYMEERQKATQAYIDRLLDAEKVKIYRDRIKGAEPKADPYQENKLPDNVAGETRETGK